MAKAVFRPGEVSPLYDKVVLESPFPDKKKEVVPDIPVVMPASLYTGPRIEDLEREAAEFRARWAAEKETMLSGANSEAELLVNGAKKASEEIIERAQAESDSIKEAAKAQSEAVVAQAHESAKQIETGANAILDEQKKSAYNEAFLLGKKEGYDAGMAEVARLTERTQVILQRIQDKRSDILNETEQQIIDLTLMIARKVVKTIPETHREVVVENIKAALTKLKARGSIIVKVNIADLGITTERREEFLKMIEGGGTIQIAEDTSVDAGGCIIETDFGEIDARIMNQLAGLEAKIKEISPIKRN
ncbi:MAG: flagellar assembly protein FliH [Termitinemataceae bacterium]|nr:MAG: flagellar assembly protein FliH [Termitinemataceae bacterium]